MDSTLNSSEFLGWFFPFKLWEWRHHRHKMESKSPGFVPEISPPHRVCLSWPPFRLITRYSLAARSLQPNSGSPGPGPPVLHPQQVWTQWDPGSLSLELLFCWKRLCVTYKRPSSRGPEASSWGELSCLFNGAWSLNFDTNEPIYPIETDSQTWRTDLWLLWGRGVERWTGNLGLAVATYYI